MTITAIEATGCDGGFSVVLEGALKYKQKNKTPDLILVAGKDRLPKEFLNVDEVNGIHIEKTEFTYHPGDNINNKKSSICRALEMHKSGEADNIIAPGDTGASVFYSFRTFNRIEGFRPAIACNFSGSVLIDVGANKECKPKHYKQFAIMGSVFSKNYLKIENPLVGIVTNGTELWKGDDLARESRPLIEELRQKGYNITEGFFEPNIFRDSDHAGFRKGLVGVTNGIFGNGILKSAETAFEIFGDIFKDEFKKEPIYNQIIAGHTLKRMGARIKQRIDYRSIATAPLMGIDGYVMICHGRSDAEAIEKAIEISKRYLDCGINTLLREEIQRCS